MGDEVGKDGGDAVDEEAPEDSDAANEALLDAASKSSSGKSGVPGVDRGASSEMISRLLVLCSSLNVGEGGGEMWSSLNVGRGGAGGGEMCRSSAVRTQ